MMNQNDQLRRKLAVTESRLDQVETELTHLNTLLVNSGFPEGIKTLKTTIEDLLGEVQRHQDDQDPPTQTYNPFES